MTDLEFIKRFIEEMNRDNSRKYKENCLLSFQHNDLIKDFLYYMYNPYITTGISRKKIEYVPDHIVLTRYCEISEIMDYVVKHNTGSNEVLDTVYSYLSSLPYDLVETAKLILTKNVQLGIEAITINKVFPKLIPTFNIQLAEKYFEHTEYVEGKEFAITTKIDGGRIIAIKEKGKVTCYTRAGQLYEGLVDVESELSDLEADNFVIDGEITLLEKGNKNSKEQYKETMKITRKDGEKHGVKILAFDYIPLYEFKEQVSNTPYLKRRHLLESTCSNMQYVTILPILYTGTDVSMITKLLDEETSKGEEGVMINFTEAPYRFRRSYDLLKVKKMQDVDLPIIGFEEGRNRHTGKLGAFLVRYKENIVKVGTGISDELREEVWNNQDKYLGVTIAVKYFEETTNDKGGISLRFPVFVDFRFDKPMN